VTVFTASSMPVRDVETFWPVRDAPPRVLAHRGANGIDGTLAAAFGAAAAGARVVVHLGDVALAHDLGALLSASRLKLELTVVLVDNGGGGIFDFLPVAEHADPAAYEAHVATPSEGVDLAALWPGLREVRTDRRQNVRLHRELVERVAASL
jgi:2-succinyl-5-enolpyruvyl-6-hydroxy-3-cyclohexene-1-carboxylate synthase